MDKYRSDLRDALRSIRLRPAASFATSCVVALGVALVTAMFMLGDPFLLRPLPYRGPNQLVSVALKQDLAAALTQASAPATRLPSVRDWTARKGLLAGVAVCEPGEPLRIRLEGGAATLRVAHISPEFFDVLGVHPSGGPIAEAAMSTSAVPLVMTAAAAERFSNGTRSVIGRSIDLQSGGRAVVVAVLPAGFLYPDPRLYQRLDALIPSRGLDIVSASDTPGGTIVVPTSARVIARLQPLVTATILEGALSAGLEGDRAWRVEVQPLSTVMSARFRPLALGAVLAAMLVLCVCAANVANLLLARSIYRVPELMVRRALGASRIDLARLIFGELCVLTGAGGLGGFALATIGIRSVRLILPHQYTALGAPSFGIRAVLCACAAAAVIIAVGALPAFAAVRSLPDHLLGGKATGSEPRRIRTVRFGIAAAQSSIAMLLFVAATLLIRSYLNLVGQDTGFRGNVWMVTASYPTGMGATVLQDAIERTLAHAKRLYGVESAAAAIGPMLNGSDMLNFVLVDGRPVMAKFKLVTADYFTTIGGRIISGRGLLGSEGGRRGAVVNESFARRYFPNRAAVGRLIGRTRPVEIVGVAQDTFDYALDVRPSPSVMWLLDRPDRGCDGCDATVNYLVRLKGPARNADPGLQRVVVAGCRDAVIVQSETIESLLSASVRDRSFATVVVILFAGASVAICLAGLVGMVVFVIARKTKEIAVRVSLGARPRDVMFLALGGAVKAAVTGVVIGLWLGRMLSDCMSSLVYGLEPSDLWSTVIAGFLMVLVSTVAAAVPSLRAVALSPSRALRVD